MTLTNYAILIFAATLRYWHGRQISPCIPLAITWFVAVAGTFLQLKIRWNMGRARQRLDGIHKASADAELKEIGLRENERLTLGYADPARAINPRLGIPSCFDRSPVGRSPDQILQMPKEKKTAEELEAIIRARLTGDPFVKVHKDSVYGWRAVAMTPPQHAIARQAEVENIVQELRGSYDLKE